MGISEPRSEFFRELVENASAEPVRSDIHFQVEHSEFRLEITTGDPLKHFRIHHARHPVGTGEIQLDLQTHQIPGPVEALLPQQPPQHREALLELRTVFLPIGQAGTARFDLLPHRRVPPSPRRPGCPGHRFTIDSAQTE